MVLCSPKHKPHQPSLVPIARHLQNCCRGELPSTRTPQRQLWHVQDAGFSAWFWSRPCLRHRRKRRIFKGSIAETICENLRSRRYTNKQDAMQTGPLKGARLKQLKGFPLSFVPSLVCPIHLGTGTDDRCCTTRITYFYANIVAIYI